MASNWWDIPAATPQSTQASPKWWELPAEYNAQPQAGGPQGPRPARLSVGKFAAETAFTALDLATKSADFLSGFVARNPEIIKAMTRPQTAAIELGVGALKNKLFGKSQIDLAFEDGWAKAIDAGAGRLTEAAMAEVEALRSAPILQPTPQYQAADLETRLTTMLPETLFHLGANVAGSALAFVGGTGFGASMAGLSVAHDVREHAVANGVPDWQADSLALGTGVLVGFIDKLVPDEIFGSMSTKTTFAKGLFNRLGGIAGTGAKESGTEVTQEAIQLAAEATVREDLTLDEAAERSIMSALGGLLGGSGIQSLATAFNGVRSTLSRAEDSNDTSAEIEAPAVPEEVISATKAETKQELLSRKLLENKQAQAKKADTRSLMEQMKDRSLPKFQQGIDRKTLTSLNIGNPAAPTIGSVFDYKGRLLVVRDVDTDGKIVGYVVPLKGEPTVSIEVVEPNDLVATTANIDSVKGAIKNMGVPVGNSRSSQFVTNEEAIKNVQRYLRPDEDLPVQFYERINTPDGGVAFGMYAGGVISLINNPHQSTVDHEVIHWYLDTNYRENEREAVYEAAREQSGQKDMSDEEAEEWVADRFVRYVRDRSGVTGVIRSFFERALALARKLFKRTNPDTISELFENVTGKVRSATPRLLQEVRETYYQNPGKLTAKIFTFPELADRTTVGRTFLSDFMKSGKANLKQSEFLLLKDVLNNQFKDQDKIDVQALKKAVEMELLPLVRASTDSMSGTNPDVDYDNPFQESNLPKYESITLPAELRGTVEDYAEHIYNSPISTSAGAKHFSNSENNLGGYFAHARTEDMTDGETRRIVEVQSDLFQKGQLEEEAKSGKDIQKLKQYSQSWWQRIIREEIRAAAVAGKKRLLFPTGETAMKIEGLGTQDNSFWLTLDHSPNGEKIGIDDLTNGKSVFDRSMDEWIITDVLGEGKFKAVPESAIPPKKQIEDVLANASTRQRYEETFDISGKVDINNPIYRYYERDVVPYILKSRKGNARLMTDGNGVSWVETAITQGDIAPVLAFQKAEQIPDEDYKAFVEAGAEPSPDGALNAADAISEYQIERELGFIPEPGQMPSGLAAEIDYRRNLSLEKMQESDANAEVEKQRAAEMLSYELDFPDAEMESGYQAFKKLAKKHPWLLEPNLEPGVIAAKLKGKKTLGTSQARFFDTEGDVTSLLFSSEVASEEDLIARYQDRIETETELVAKINEKTPAEIRAEAKRLAEKTVKDASIRKNESVKTTIKKIYSTAPSQTLTIDEATLLRKQLYDMAVGSKTGFEAGKKFMQNALVKKARQEGVDRVELLNQAADYLEATLPPKQRARFIRKLKDIKNAKTLYKVMYEVDAVAEKTKKTEAIEEFADQAIKFKKGAANISLKYQEYIRDIISSFDGKRPTAKTLQRLLATAKFADKNPDAYFPPWVAADIKRLTKVPLADMTLSQIEDINNTVKKLITQGGFIQEMKNAYDERAWEKSVAEAVAGTVNRDFTGGEGTAKVAYDAALSVFDNINAPARVMDAMDGEVDSGPNKKLQRSIRDGSLKAGNIAQTIMQEMQEDIAAAGVKSLSTEQIRVIALHSYLAQGYGASVTYTMKELGIEKLRAMTEKETKVLEAWRKAASSLTDGVESVYELKHNEKFIRVENYTPARFADDNPTTIEALVLEERMLLSSAEPGSVIARKENVERLLRTDDYMLVLAQSIEAQANYVFLEPVLMDVAAVVRSEEYREKAGVHNRDYWLEYLDAVVRNGVSANALKAKFIDPAIKGLRFNVTAAILGGRATTVFLQPFNLFHAYGTMQQRYGFMAANRLFKQATLSFFMPGYAKEVTDESPSLTLRKGGDATVREMMEQMGAFSSKNWAKKARNKAIEVSLKAMKSFDIRTAATVDQSIYLTLKAEGYSDADARSEADYVTDLLVSSSQIADKPLVFSKGEGVKMFTMFQSFAFNEWGIITHDILKKGIYRGDAEDRLRAVFSLSLIVASKLGEQVMRDILRDLLRKKEKREELPSIPAMTAFGIIGLVPLVGPTIVGGMKGYQGSTVDSPLVSSVDDMISGTMSIAKGKSPKTKARGAVRVAKSALILSGVPFVPLALDWLKNNLID